MTATDKLSPLEKAARAIYEAEWESSEQDRPLHAVYTSLHKAEKREYEAIAHAVLLAVRGEAQGVIASDEARGRLWPPHAAKDFTAMIDAILEGE